MAEKKKPTKTPKKKPTQAAATPSGVVRGLVPEILPAESKKKISKPLPKKVSGKKLAHAEILEPEEFDPLDEVDEGDSDQATDSDTDSDDDSDLDSEASENTDLVPLESIDQALVTASRAISPTDPLRRYLDEVRHYPLLTPEEEIALAMKLHASGDLDAAKRLVQANLRLVVKIAFEYKSVYANVMDLIQEGNIGLMKAVSKYDPSKGAKVGYYSSWWIRSYILKYLLDNFRLVRVGTTAAQKKLFFHLMREKERLEAQGVFAGPKLLADRLQVREKDVIEMEKRLGSSGNEISIDAPSSPNSERSSSFSDFLEHGQEGADETLAREQMLAIIRERLPEFEKSLNDREKRILKDRLLNDEPKTLQEVADHYGLTRERARQIEAGVLTKLREFLSGSLK